ncbi:MAG TPA: DUF805 domain-containing protein, partial [Sphingomicrobium sp.]
MTRTVPNQFSLRLALKPFRDSLRFRGRSTRTELLSFWMLYIAALALFVGAAMIGGAVFGANVADWVEAPGVILLAITFWLPAPALIARRLHDVGLAGWPGALFVAAYGIAATVGPLVDRTYLLPLAIRIVV